MRHFSSLWDPDLAHIINKAQTNNNILFLRHFSRNYRDLVSNPFMAFRGLCESIFIQLCNSVEPRDIILS